MKTFQQMLDENKLHHFMNRQFELNSTTSTSFTGVPLYGQQQSEWSQISLHCNHDALQPSITAGCSNAVKPTQLDYPDVVRNINEKYRFKMNASFGSAAKWQQDAYSTFASSNSTISSFIGTGSIIQGVNSICVPATKARQRVQSWKLNNPHHTIPDLSSSIDPAKSKTDKLMNSNNTGNSADHHSFKVPLLPTRLQPNTIHSAEKIIRNVHDWHFHYAPSGFHLRGLCADSHGKLRKWISRPLTMYRLSEDQGSTPHSKSLKTTDGTYILHLGCFKPSTGTDRRKSGGPSYIVHPKYIVDSFQNGFPKNWTEILDLWCKFIEKEEPIDFQWSQEIDVPVDKAFSLKKFITDPFNNIIPSVNAANTSACIKSIAKFVSPVKSLQNMSISQDKSKQNDNSRLSRIEERSFVNTLNYGDDTELSLESPKNSVAPSNVSNHVEKVIKDLPESSEVPLNFPRRDSINEQSEQIAANRVLSSTESRPNVIFTKGISPRSLRLKQSYNLTSTLKIQSSQQLAKRSKSSCGLLDHSNQKIQTSKIRNIMVLTHWRPILQKSKTGTVMSLLGTKVGRDGSVEKNHMTKAIVKLCRNGTIETNGEFYAVKGGMVAGLRDVPLFVRQSFSSNFHQKWREVLKKWKKYTESVNKPGNCEPSIQENALKTTVKKSSHKRSAQKQGPSTSVSNTGKKAEIITHNQHQSNRLAGQQQKILQQKLSLHDSLPLHSIADYGVFQRSSRGRIIVPRLEYWRGERVTQSQYNKGNDYGDSSIQTRDMAGLKGNKGCKKNQQLKNVSPDCHDICLEKEGQRARKKSFVKPKPKQKQQTSNVFDVPKQHSSVNTTAINHPAKKPTKRKRTEKSENDQVDFTVLLAQLGKGRKQLSQKQQLQLQEAKIKERCRKDKRMPDMFEDEEFKKQLEDTDSDDSHQFQDWRKDIKSMKTPERLGTPTAKYCVGMRLPDRPITPLEIRPLTTKERKEIIAYGKQRDAELKVKLPPVKRPQLEPTDMKSLAKTLFSQQSQGQSQSSRHFNQMEDDIYSETDSRLDILMNASDSWD